MSNQDLKIAFIPLDNRPVSYVLPQQICAIYNNLKIFIPPREIIGGLVSSTNIQEVLKWLKLTFETEKIDILVMCLDTLAYGGLVQSRRSPLSKVEVVQNINNIKNLIEKYKVKTYAFSSIMRISNNNVNEEEKLYWDKYGTLLFRYSYLADCERRLKVGSDELSIEMPFSASNQEADCERRLKVGSEELLTEMPFSVSNQDKVLELEIVKKQIPEEILADYLATRQRNFEINKMYLDWVKDKTLDYVVFSQDDTAQYGLNVEEGEVLNELISQNELTNNAIIKTGADEIPCDLIALAVTKAIGRTVKIFPKFANPQSVDLISRYENVSVKKSTESQIELCGGTVTQSETDSDIVLFVNNFLKAQGDHAMQINAETQLPQLNDKLFEKPLIVADLINANGCDDEFAKLLLSKDFANLYGFAGWNTTGNTLGSCITTGIIKYLAILDNAYNDEAFKKVLLTRFLDDWAYQTIVRQTLRAVAKNSLHNAGKNVDPTVNINLLNNEMQHFALIVGKKLGVDTDNIKYSFPWNRTFELEILG